MSPSQQLSVEDRQTGFCTPSWQHAEEKTDVNLVICLESERQTVSSGASVKMTSTLSARSLALGSVHGGPTQMLWQLRFQREKDLYSENRWEGIRTLESEGNRLLQALVQFCDRPWGVLRLRTVLMVGIPIDLHTLGVWVRERALRVVLLVSFLAVDNLMDQEPESQYRGVYTMLWATKEGASQRK